MAQLFSRIPVDYEPKKKNRFVFEFDNGTLIDHWVVRTGGRPKISINEVEIPYMNTSTWVAGRYIWDTIDVTFIDPIGPSSSQKIMEWIRLCAESVTGRMGYAAGYKKNIVLKALDPTGIDIEKWILEGAFITSADFGDLSYEDDSLMDVTVTLRYDRAVLSF